MLFFSSSVYACIMQNVKAYCHGVYTELLCKVDIVLNSTHLSVWVLNL